jgi:hypothetical protein
MAEPNEAWKLFQNPMTLLQQACPEPVEGETEGFEMTPSSLRKNSFCPL